MIWLIVGIGYAVRAGLGLWAADVSLTEPAGMSGLASFAAFGIMFVLLTWVLEAASYSYVDEKKRVWRHTADLAAKPHLAALLRFVDPPSVRPVPPPAKVATCGSEKILRERGQPLAPWNIALGAATIAGAAFGTALGGGTRPAHLWFALVVVSFIGAVLLIAAAGTLWRVVVLAAGVAAVAGTSVAVGVAIPLMATTPWLVFGLWYVGFRESSYHDLKHAAANIAFVLAEAMAKILRWLVGRDTWTIGDFEQAKRRWAERHGYGSNAK